MKELSRTKIGFAVTGSFCTFSKIEMPLKQLVSHGADVIPILSPTVAAFDTRFARAEEFRKNLEALTKNAVIDSIPAAEPIGPKKLLDLLIIAPCTGNTLAKLAVGITDTAVTMAAKAHLRNGRPVLLAVSSNDALSANAANLGSLLNRKHYYFVPFSQDDYRQKPTSLVADLSLIPEAAQAAINGIQLQPLLSSPK